VLLQGWVQGQPLLVSGMTAPAPSYRATPGEAAEPDTRALAAMRANASLQQLPAAVLADWASRCAVWHVPAGQVFAEQGSIPDVCFCVLEGAAELSIGNEGDSASVLDLLERGQWVGAEALLSNTALPFQVRTFGPCVLLVMRRSVLRDLQQRHAAVSQAMLDLGWRLCQRLVQWARIRSDPALSGRLRQTLELLADRFGVQDGCWIRIALPLTQSGLARILGCSRQRANIELQKLRRSGELRSVRQCYAIAASHRAAPSALRNSSSERAGTCG